MNDVTTDVTTDVTNDVTTDKVKREDAVIRRALRIMEQRAGYAPDKFITSPETTAKYLKLRLADKEREVFACMFLDNRHGLVKYEELFYGTVDGATVNPREVVKAALKCNAAAVIFAHNHPSGNPEPSRADEQITQRLKDSLALIEVRTLDHIIIGKMDSCSFAERGLM